MTNLSDPVAVVTGDGRGIGRAISLLAAERGFRVCLSDASDARAAKRVVAAIATAGGNAIAPGIIGTEVHASGGTPDKAVAMGPGVPMKRAGAPEKVAAPIVRLLPEEAAYTTGAILEVSGGR